MSETNQDVEVDRRKNLAKGLVVRPREQFRYAFLIIGTSVIVQAGIVLLFMHAIQIQLGEIFSAYRISPEAGAVIIHSIVYLLVITFVASLGCALLAMAAGLKLSHRIFGPLVPINRQIEALVAGNYAARITLRDKDDLNEIRDGLNLLATTLEKRHPGAQA